jgi:hypothetical protein
VAEIHAMTAALVVEARRRLGSWRTKIAAVLLLSACASATGTLLAPEKGAEEAEEFQTAKSEVRRKQGNVRVSMDLYGDPLPAGALARMGTVRLRHGGSVDSVAFSPDGKLLATSSDGSDPTIRLWSVATGKEVRRIQVFPPIPRTNALVLRVAFSPDGKTLASGAFDASMIDNKIDFWDAETKTPAHKQGTQARDHVRGLRAGRQIARLGRSR